MNIVVLGGSGFIGARLVSALLAAGHRVRIFDKRASSVHPGLVTLGDVRDPAAVAQALADCECAINLAAEHSDDVRPSSLYFDVNVGGARNLVAAAEKNAVLRLLFVSSVSVYGLDQPNADERAPLLPSNDYGRSKAQAETVYAAWQSAAAAQRSLSVVRPCVVFGEGNRGNVHNLIDHIQRGRFVMVGDGGNRKSIAYVGNLVDFLCTQLHSSPGIQCYNYADKPDLSTRELVQQIRSQLGMGSSAGFGLPYPIAMTIGASFDVLAFLSGRSYPISRARVRKFCADTRIATTMLQGVGFQAAVSLSEGLARTVAHLLGRGP